MERSWVTTIDCNAREFFYHWVQFTAPFHKLPEQLKKVLAELLYKRYLLSEYIVQKDKLNYFLFSREVIGEVRKILGYTANSMSQALSALRAKGIITDNQIVPGIIPVMPFGSAQFNYTIVFKLKEDEGKSTGTEEC